MIQGGMFGFPLLLIVLVVLLAIQPIRELGLIIASLYMTFRVSRRRIATGNNRSETEPSDRS